jgi:hypothetical protein
MRFRIAALLFFCLLASPMHPVSAQQKVSRTATLWPELQFQYVFRSTSFLFFRNHYRHVLDNDFNQLRDQGALQYLERLQFRLGYEHVFNAAWQAGISESYALERSRKILFHEIYARHTEAVGKFRFSQRASFEHLMRWPRNDNGRFRLRAELDRTFPLGPRRLRPRAAYELFFYTYYPAGANNGIENRTVDRSRLRLDCQLRFNKHVAVTPYYMRQTDFYVVEPAFDGEHNVVRPGGKQNHVTPVWGVEVLFAVFAKGQASP